MKQQKFEVKLMRQIEGEWKVIKTACVYEFDDDCVDANVFYAAQEVFKGDIENYDVINCCTGSRNYTQLMNGSWIIR